MLGSLNDLSKDEDRSKRIAAVWDMDIYPLLNAEQRKLVKEGCTSDELKGFSVAYEILEKFASRGYDLIEKDKTKK